MTFRGFRSEYMKSVITLKGRLYLFLGSFRHKDPTKQPKGSKNVLEKD